MQTSLLYPRLRAAHFLSLFGSARGRGLFCFLVGLLLLGSLLPGLVQAQTFANPTSITIPATGSDGPGTPYPSDITVSGLTGVITKVTVTLKGYNHTFPGDVDVLLVGPTGQNTLIISDVGGTTNVVGVTLTFDDAASTSLTSPITSGTYTPTNLGAVDVFPAPTPAVSSTVASLSVFNGTAPNGTWSLYVLDDAIGDIGDFSGGWELSITTTSPPTNPCNTLPAVTLVFNNSATVMGTGIPTITVANTPGQQFQVFGGSGYEFVAVLDRINGYEIRQRDENSTGVFTIKQGGPFSITVRDGNGCSRTVQGILAMQ